MVLPVAHGGFVSSSTSRCRKRLNLLLLPLLNKEIPMKISPWNQYQFAWQEAKHNIQLSSKKLRVSQGCVSLIHFLRSCTTIKRLSSLKLGKQHHSRPASDSSSVKGTADSAPCCVAVENESKLRLKSCLKKQSKDCCSSDVQMVDLSNHCNGVKKVHWPDSCGKELAVVMTFNDIDNYSSG